MSDRARRPSRVTLGLDVGTQGTKGLAIDVDAKRVVARASRGYGLIEGLPPGAAEQHPATWIDACRGVVDDLRSQPGVADAEIVGVGVSGQQHGLVLLDEHDEVVRPAKLWCDTSTAAEAEELSATLGRAVPAGYTAPKIAWVARREPANWERARHVLLPHDYVNFLLTGRKAMEPGDASGTGFLDVVARRFDQAAMDAIDPALASRVPELVASDSVLGAVTADGGRLFGLPAGTPVSAGGGDNMMAAIGAGAARHGVCALSLGTSGTAFARSASPVVDDEGRVAAFCDSAGAWLPLVCVMNVTRVPEEVTGAFGRTHDELAELASREPIGTDGLLWVPYLVGERVPNLPDATGTLLGMRPGSLHPGRLYRAALEGTSLGLGHAVDHLRRTGLEPSRFHVVGGGSRSPLWLQVLAGVLDRPLVALEEPESAALGAAVQVEWALQRAAGDPTDIADVAEPYVHTVGGEVAPAPREGAAYADLRARFEQALTHLHGVAPRG